jgi:hypothetical protein
MTSKGLEGATQGCTRLTSDAWRQGRRQQRRGCNPHTAPTKRTTLVRTTCARRQKVLHVQVQHAPENRGGRHVQGQDGGVGCHHSSAPSGREVPHTHGAVPTPDHVHTHMAEYNINHATSKPCASQSGPQDTAEWHDGSVAPMPQQDLCLKNNTTTPASHTTTQPRCPAAPYPDTSSFPSVGEKARAMTSPTWPLSANNGGGGAAIWWYSNAQRHSYFELKI